MTEPSFPRSEIRVVLFEGISDTAAEAFREAGYENVQTHPRALTGDELVAAVRPAHVIGIRSRTQLSAEVLAEAKKLVAVGCFCIGTDQVDLGFARRRGVPVFNAPYSNTRSVAELVIAEAILLLRRIPERNMGCHRGDWQKSAAGSHEARGKTIGIVGYGHIGSQVGVLAEMLGMRVLYHDVTTKLPLGNVEPARDLDDLLERSDAVTLHVPDAPDTIGLIGADEIRRMRPGAVLINASRGKVVDLEALRGALLGGHIGGSTEEAQAGIGREVAAKLLRYSDDGSTLSAVGFPEVTLPPQRAGARLLHVHENQPGMLGAINDVIGRGDANIDAQFLRTVEDVGYVVTDVEASREASLALQSDLRAIPGTLRSRVLF